jgi:hypothetical protein
MDPSEFRRSVLDEIEKRSENGFSMDYYRFSEKMMLLLAAFDKDYTAPISRAYMTSIAVNWRELADAVVKSPEPLSGWYNWNWSKQTDCISLMLNHVCNNLDAGERPEFCIRIRTIKDALNELLPKSRAEWMPFYASLDYELARRQGEIIASYPRFESVTVSPKALISLMAKVKAKRLPYNTPRYDVQNLLKCQGRGYILNNGVFSVFDPEIAMLCRLGLDIQPFTTDFPPINVYPADLDREFRRRYLASSLVDH